MAVRETVLDRRREENGRGGSSTREILLARDETRRRVVSSSRQCITCVAAKNPNRTSRGHLIFYRPNCTMEWDCRGCSKVQIYTRVAILRNG